MNLPRFGWDYPAGCSGPPEPTQEELMEDRISDRTIEILYGDELAEAIASLYDSVEIAETLAAAVHLPSDEAHDILRDFAQRAARWAADQQYTRESP